MILDALINVAYLAVSTIIGWFPYGAGLPTEVHTAVQSLGGYFGLLDALVPIQTLTTVVGLVFVFELGLFGFKTLRWLASYIPFIGGSR